MPPPNHRWSAVTVDCVDPDRLARFWGALLGFSPIESLPGWVRLAGAGEVAPVINFQPVSEPKHGKARLHLDVAVADIAEAVAAVDQLGGRWLDERHDYNEGVVMVMADPEGNEFCLVQYFE